MRVPVTVLIVCLICLHALPQTAPPDQPAKRAAASKPAPSKPGASKDLDPNQQRAITLLRQASAQAATFEGPMRATVLFFIGQAYAKIDPKLSREAILSAYEASKEFDPKQVGVRSLRTQIMSAAQKLAPEVVEENLPEDPRQRDSAIQGTIDRKLKTKDYEGAIELLRAMSTEPKLSAEAGQIIEALPPDASTERNAVFASVINRYQSGTVQDFGGGVLDVSDLLLDHWKQVRPQLVDEMISELLRRAEDADADSGRPRMQVTVHMGDGTSLPFDNKYKLRLFQLFPVLRSIDPARAERLLRDNPDLQPALKQFPEGLTGDIKPISYSMSTGPRIPTSVTHDAGEQIVADAVKHPDNAIANARQLTPIHRRVMVLLDIAEACIPAYETAAKSATDYAVDAADGSEADTWPLQMPRAARIYLKLKDEKSAEKALEKAADSARKLYDQDTNADDPNRALKLYWPSTMMWQEVVPEQDKVSQQLALTTIKEIPDPEIQALARVWLASSVLDVHMQAYSSPSRVFKRYSAR
jgi:hypothetical protein